MKLAMKQYLHKMEYEFNLFYTVRIKKPLWNQFESCVLTNITSRFTISQKSNYTNM